MANFLWRRRQNRNGKTEPLNGAHASDMELTIPSHFRCPISLDLMKDPVSLSTGITYDRESIEKWFDSGNATCPLTNQLLLNLHQTPNHAIRKMIQDWCVQNKPRGVERIPTPRVPITPYEVADIRSEISEAIEIGDEDKCRELVRNITRSAKESERNKRCLVSNGVGSSLARMVESFARFPIEKHAGLLGEILSALVWSFPIEKQGVSVLRSSVCLRCVAWFLSDEDLKLRGDAVFVLKELVYEDGSCADDLVEVEGIEEALVRIVKVPICPKATHACLAIVHRMMIVRSEKGRAVILRFVELGIVPLVLDLLVDGSKSVCEKGLGVLDGICGVREGKESACSNELTVPLVVKKILRVSDTGTGYSVSILWRVVMGGSNESGLVEAVRVGAFQKLLVVLQVGCGERTKEKVSELLRLMNMYRHKLDCFDSSMGFKQLQRT